jgi:hypothetical protein
MNIAIRKMTASDAVAVFLRAAEGMDPKIAAAFIQAIETIRVRVPAEKIALLLERRDYTTLENAFSGHFTSTEWQPYGKAIEQAVLAGTKATSDTQGVVNGAQEDFEIRVGLNPRLEQFAQTMTSTRIREIDQTTRDTIRQVIQSGTTAGDDPFAIARRIRGSIGLTRSQEAAVNNYERMLRALDPAVLERKLRDRRSDPTVARAISNDKALTDAQVRSLVDRYRDRYVKYRANVIGRTESIRAVQGAQWELFQDMINKGQIDARQVRRTWITTNDGHVRDAHVQIPSMNPRGVGQAETFSSPLGPILYPGDPSALAANTIQCRCAVFARIISRGLLPSSPGAIVAPPPPPPRPVPSAPPPAPVISDAERRRRIWANKTPDERLNVAPAFMETDPARMAVIEKVGYLKGGVKFAAKGAHHDGSIMQIQMDNTNTADLAYQRVMRHEYGHHIDARIEVDILDQRKLGGPNVRAGVIGPSRLAYPDMEQDAALLRRQMSGAYTNGWVKDPARIVPGNRDFKAEIEEARTKVRRTLREILRSEKSDDEKRIAVEGLFTDRELDYAYARKFYSHLLRSDDVNDVSYREGVIDFLAAFDTGDHRALIYDAISIDHASPLSGLSDTLGALTNQDIGYMFGHEWDYYTQFANADRTWGPQLDKFGFNVFGKGSLNPYSTKFAHDYGTGNAAQAWANWFDAYMSGNKTEYTIFKRLFPNTSARFERIIQDYLDGKPNL